tara:strand:+ start:23200 stop:23301 length:102 start_codon:yes stop_codon:yes gene_type:complete
MIETKEGRLGNNALKEDGKGIEILWKSYFDDVF